MATPSSVDGFSRYFAKAFKEPEIIGIVTSAIALFSRRKPVIKTDANVIDIDIIRGNEKTAAFIPRGTVGEYLKNKNIDTGKYTNFSRLFPLSEEEFDIGVEQTENRMADESPYSGKLRRERMRDKAIEAYHEMIRRTVRLWERAAWSSLLTGTQPTILGTVDPNLILDYKRDSTLIETYGAPAQYTTAGVDPIADIDSKIDLLVKKGKVGGQSGGHYVTIMGNDVINGFFGNAAVIAAGDNRRILSVVKNPQLTAPAGVSDLIAGGMNYIAQLSTNKGRTVHIMVYDAYYDTDALANIPYMPDKSMLIMPMVFRADRYFGPGDTLPMNSLDKTYLRETFGITASTPIGELNIKAAAGVIVPQAFYVDAYPGAARKNAVLRLQSAPIFATTQTDALFTGNDVVA